MIPIPPHAVRGQTLTADLLNRILDALRAVRPLQGQGILLRETAQGVVIEATAKAKTTQAAAAQTAHLPFELRVREGTGGPFLDIYSPKGTVARFLNENGRTETLESVWEKPLPAAPDAGWHTFGDLAGLAFGAAGACRVTLDLAAEETFALAASDAPAAEGAVTVGHVYRTGKGTEAEPYAYALGQRVAGAFIRAYVWLGAEGLFVQNGSTLTDDPDAVAWTRETQAWLCRLYALTAEFPVGGRLTLANPCADLPTGSQDGNPVFASKLAARAHAADHIEDFIPFGEAGA